ncbi:MAG TPA: DUF1702 family protein [Acetobacteraceae bacterium]|nr:DUF1702 family protein [Acetobacteraceae bacterium]
MRRHLLGIDPVETSMVRRDFMPTSAERRHRLEAAGSSFVAGYNAAVGSADPATIGAVLAAEPDDRAGFAYEGAGMGFALLDLISPWRGRRFVQFLAGAADRHLYMAHVGAGWALARMSRHLAWRLGPLDPLLRWLVLDGYGFHAGYFHPTRAIAAHRLPRGLTDNVRAGFDQGLGRSLWFVCGAQPHAVIATIATFPSTRHPDLWSGVGLAIAYAGGADEAELHALAEQAAEHRLHVGQGAAFAAKARSRAGNPAPHTDLACRVFCGTGANTAAAFTDRALPIATAGDNGAAYQRWRAGIRDLIATHEARP